MKNRKINWSESFRARSCYRDGIGNTVYISKRELRTLKGKPLSYWKEFVKEKREVAIYAMELFEKERSK